MLHLCTFVEKIEHIADVLHAQPLNAAKLPSIYT